MREESLERTSRERRSARRLRRCWRPARKRSPRAARASTSSERSCAELEDSPLFNAGKGSVFNAHGEHELDASIMDGRSLNAGAVANVRNIKNPVALARLVMERSPHVFLQGARRGRVRAGARHRARRAGLLLDRGSLAGAEGRAAAQRREAASRPRHGRRRGARPAGQSCGRDVDRRRHQQGAGPHRRLGGHRRRNICEQRVVRRVVHGPGRILHSRDHCARHLRAHGICGERCTRSGGHRDRAPAPRASVAAAARSPSLRTGTIACAFNTEMMYRGGVTHATPVQIGVRAKDAP